MRPEKTGTTGKVWARGEPSKLGAKEYGQVFKPDDIPFGADNESAPHLKGDIDWRNLFSFPFIDLIPTSETLNILFYPLPFLTFVNKLFLFGTPLRIERGCTERKTIPTSPDRRPQPSCTRNKVS